jgi:hypothetical protein
MPCVAYRQPSIYSTEATIPSKENIIAIDPGEMTGWARGYIEDGALTVEAHGYTPWQEFVITFADRMSQDDPPYNTIVYESWRLRRSSALDLVGSDLQSSQCIGALKLSCWLAQKRGHIIRVRNQEPAIKNVVDAMKGGKDYLPKADKEHAKDAVRHIWYYAITEQEVAP